MDSLSPENKNGLGIVREAIDDVMQLKFARALGRLAAGKNMNRYDRDKQARITVIPALGDRSYDGLIEETIKLIEEEMVTQNTKDLFLPSLSEIRESNPVDLLLVKFRNTLIGAEGFDLGDKIINEYNMPVSSKVLDDEKDKLTVAAIIPPDDYFEWYWKEGRYAEKSLRHLMKNGLIFRQIVSVDDNGRGRKPADIDERYLFECSRGMGSRGAYYRRSQAYNLAVALDESLKKGGK